uniref:SFRICE_026361 n=1 Tax=Spodoptera frugiperda TaxID=7108 RepID=A0A2H1UZU6_SPOFR
MRCRPFGGVEFLAELTYYYFYGISRQTDQMMVSNLDGYSKYQKRYNNCVCFDTNGRHSLTENRRETTFVLYFVVLVRLPKTRNNHLWIELKLKELFRAGIEPATRLHSNQLPSQQANRAVSFEFGFINYFLNFYFSILFWKKLVTVEESKEKLIQLRPLIRIVRTAHRQCLHVIRTDDVIWNADAKNPSDSGIGNPNAANTVDTV